MTLIQRRLNVDATSWRCIDFEPTLYKRHVPAGSSFTQIDMEVSCYKSLEMLCKEALLVMLQVFIIPHEQTIKTVS